jgi:hypothetical protein
MITLVVPSHFVLFHLDTSWNTALTHCTSQINAWWWGISHFLTVQHTWTWTNHWTEIRFRKRDILTVSRPTGNDYDIEECHLLGRGAVYILCDPTFRRKVLLCSGLLDTSHAGSLLAYFSTLKIEAIRSSETSVHTHIYGVTSQKTAFFIVTIMKAANPTIMTLFRKTENPCEC